MQRFIKCEFCLLKCSLLRNGTVVTIRRKLLFFSFSSVLPDSFIETLGLDPSNQQDAQEFSNLWMGLLQHRFGTAFSRLFCGSCDVTTVCESCGNSSRRPDEFSELILNVPASDAQTQNAENTPSRRASSSVALEDVMRRYFGDEVLDGDNAYSCKCGTTGKAVRQTRLEKAPLILNAQVLRFAFDPVKMTRKKLRNVISFPEVLELRQEVFAEDSPELKKDKLPCYRLKAILCHFGTSVNRGHYTARIRLPEGWYTFNDASVKKGDPTSGGDGGVDADDTSTSSRRFRSADAYCLVYHRVDSTELQEECNLSEEVSMIPEDLKLEVEKVEEQFKNELEKKREDLLAVSDAKEQVREQRLRIHNEMTLDLPPLEQWKQFELYQLIKLLEEQPSGMPVLVHRDWLTDYLSLKPLDTGYDGKEFGLGREALCEHSRLNFNLAGKLKLISRSAIEMISDELYLTHRENNQVLIFTPNDICVTCARLHCFEVFFRDKAATLVNDLKSELKLIDSGVDNDVERDYWVARESLEKFSEIVERGIEEALNVVQNEVLHRFKARQGLYSLNQTQETNNAKENDVVVGAENNLNKELNESLGNGDTSALTENSVAKRNSLVISGKGGTKVQYVPVITKVDPDSPVSGPTPNKKLRMTSPICQCEPKEEAMEAVSSLENQQIEEAIKASLENDISAKIAKELDRTLVEEVFDVAFLQIHTDINQGIVCKHGGVWYAAPQSKTASQTKRRSNTNGLVLIQETLWKRICDFFPESMALCSSSFDLCQQCLSGAEAERNENDRIRENNKAKALTYGALAKRQKRTKVQSALRTVYLVPDLLCERLNTYISGQAPWPIVKRVGDTSIHNFDSLCQHGRLPYKPDELAAEVDSENPKWVACKPQEWKALKEDFNVDIEIYLKPVLEKKDKMPSNGEEMRRFHLENFMCGKSTFSPNQSSPSILQKCFETQSV